MGGGGYLHFMFCVGDSDSCDMLATPKCSPFSYLLFFCPWKVVTGIKVLWSKTMSVVLWRELDIDRTGWKAFIWLTWAVGLVVRHTPINSIMRVGSLETRIQTLDSNRGLWQVFLWQQRPEDERVYGLWRGVDLRCIIDWHAQNGRTSVVCDTNAPRRLEPKGSHTTATRRQAVVAPRTGDGEKHSPPIIHPLLWCAQPLS